MEKRVLIGGLLLLLATAVLASAQPKITITAPPNPSTLIMGTSCTIQWTHSAYFTGTAQKCTVYCGTFAISPLIPVTQDQFVWTVGKKADGTNIPAGTYKIAIESPDYDALDGPNVTLKFLSLNWDRLGKLRITKIPDCPMCFGLPLDQLQQLNFLLPCELELFHGQRSLGRLGKFLSGRLPTGSAKLLLDQADLLAIQKGGPGFELRAIIDDGWRTQSKLLIALEIQK